MITWVREEWRLGGTVRLMPAVLLAAMVQLVTGALAQTSVGRAVGAGGGFGWLLTWGGTLWALSQLTGAQYGTALVFGGLLGFLNSAWQLVDAVRFAADEQTTQTIGPLGIVVVLLKVIQLPVDVAVTGGIMVVLTCAAKYARLQVLSRRQ